MDFRTWYFSHNRERMKDLKKQIENILNPEDSAKANNRLHNLLSKRVKITHLEKQEIEKISGFELVFEKITKKETKN